MSEKIEFLVSNMPKELIKDIENKFKDKIEHNKINYLLSFFDDEELDKMIEEIEGENNGKKIQ